MKVLKSGNQRPKKPAEIKNWKTEARCQRRDKWDRDGEGCGAVIEVTTKDLKLMYYRGTHFRHYYAGIECPECRKKLNIRVPDDIFKKLQTETSEDKAIFDGVTDVC